MTYEIPILDYNPPSIARQVFDYVAKHPGCSRTEIKHALGVHGSTVSTNLTRLREAGRIKRNRTDNSHRAGVRWEVGTEEGLIARESLVGAPKQETVSTWAPVTVRDPLIDLFFGRAA